MSKSAKRTTQKKKRWAQLVIYLRGVRVSSSLSTIEYGHCINRIFIHCFIHDVDSVYRYYNNNSLHLHAHHNLLDFRCIYETLDERIGMVTKVRFKSVYCSMVKLFCFFSSISSISTVTLNSKWKSIYLCVSFLANGLLSLATKGLHKIFWTYLSDVLVNAICQ